MRMKVMSRIAGIQIDNLGCSYGSIPLFCHKIANICSKLCLLLYIPKKWYKIHFFGIKAFILNFSLIVYPNSG